MGSDAADINNDGAIDLLTLDMLPNSNYRDKMTSGADNFDKYQMLRGEGFAPQNMRNMLQLNDGQGAFQEVGQLFGISNTDWSWSALFADYDLDGWQDAFITNGYLRDYTNMDFLAYTVDQKIKSNQADEEANIKDLLSKMPKIELNNQAFLNRNGGGFKEVSEEWGFSKPLLSNGATYADLDNDGDLDLVVNNVNETASVYQNTAIEKELGNFLKIKPKDYKIHGFSVTVFVGDLIMKRELFVSRGYQSSVEPIIHFGIPRSVQQVDSVIINWSNQSVSKHIQVPVNTTLEISPSNVLPIAVETNEESIFKPVNLLNYQHAEDSFNDFKIQGLLPWFYSRQGPAFECADFNGDQLMDCVIGGASQQATVLFQGKGKSFSLASQPALAKDVSAEDIAMGTGDFNGDGSLDLVIASGGNRVADHSNQYPVRLYFNNGNGQFSSPINLVSISCHATTLTIGDIDQDQDLDIFVASNYKAWNYPHAEENHLLINDGTGKFEKQTSFPFQQEIINDAHIVDIDQDGHSDLVFAGEWGQVQVWNFKNEKWTKVFSGQEKGWWNEMHCVNLDEDKELEIVVGNFGRNSQFKASSLDSISLFYGDFDANGAVDPILVYSQNGQQFPFVPRDDLLQQLPNLKKLFPDYQSYAEAEIGTILKGVDQVNTHSINDLESVIYDIEDGQLIKKKLPALAQVAPVYAIESLDFDADGDLDLVLAGNLTFSRVKIGEIDANHGLLLENLGNLKFQPVAKQISGLDIRGDVRSCQVIDLAGKKYLFFGINNAPFRTYELNFSKTQL